MNGKMIVVGVSMDPIEVLPLQLIFGNRSVQGWTTRIPTDLEDTLRFAELTGVRPMIEKYPLVKAGEAYARMMSGKAEFRMSSRCRHSPAPSQLCPSGAAPGSTLDLLATLAAMLAFIPLTFSSFWGSLAYVLIGGVGVGTILTLLFLPALYALWFRVKRQNELQQADARLG